MIALLILPISLTPIIISDCGLLIAEFPLTLSLSPLRLCHNG